VIAALFFRRLTLMIVAAGLPLLAIVFALGALGWLGFRLNMFLNVMTPLIMVISFSDSMQLTFAARDQLMAGRDKRTAFRNAILIVGRPACSPIAPRVSRFSACSPPRATSSVASARRASSQPPSRSPPSFR